MKIWEKAKAGMYTPEEMEAFGRIQALNAAIDDAIEEFGEERAAAAFALALRRAFFREDE